MLSSLSLDLDNQWSYMKTHGDAGWESFPSYLDTVIPRFLEQFADLGLTTTVFVVGQDAALEKNAAALASIAAAGHEIGNHSFHHEPWLHRYSREQLECELERAELAIEQLKLQLEDAELRAPFDGTVADLDVKLGDEVVPGQVVLVLATLDQLQVKTTDLTELDVGRISLDSPVEVSIDALPDETFAGVVSEIALQGQDYRGDVVYAVTVELTDVSDVPLRWGMTAMVEIETE